MCKSKIIDGEIQDHQGGPCLLPEHHTTHHFQLLPAKQVERGDLPRVRTPGRQSGEASQASDGSQFGEKAFRQAASEGSLFLMVAGGLNTERTRMGGLRSRREFTRGQGKRGRSLADSRRGGNRRALTLRADTKRRRRRGRSCRAGGSGGGEGGGGVERGTEAETCRCDQLSPYN